MARDADIVVVGAGVVGAATARALAGTFGTVVLLEQFALGHAHGSSHGTSRIFRLNYPDERYVRMAQAAGEAWRELERERDVQLLVRSGSLDLGPVAAETARALAACGVRYETLSAEEVRVPLAAPTRRGRDGGLPGRRRDRPRRPRPPCASRERVRRRRRAPRERPGAVARARAKRRPGHARQRRALGTVRRRHGGLVVAPAPRGRRDRASRRADARDGRSTSGWTERSPRRR